MKEQNSFEQTLTFGGFMDDDIGRSWALTPDSVAKAIARKDFDKIDGTKEAFKLRALSDILLSELLFGNPIVVMESWPVQTYAWWPAFIEQKNIHYFRLCIADMLSCFLKNTITCTKSCLI